MKALPILASLALCVSAHAAPPTVSNVRASQRAGTKYVDIYYDLADPDSSSLSVTILVSKDAGATWTVPALMFTGAQGGGVSPGVNKYVMWNAGADWDGQFTSQCRVRVIANDADPEGFVLIPTGSFQMGDTLDGDSTARPVHSVYVSPFYMEKALVTGARWKAVYQWAVIHGYSFDHAGSWKATEHPVQTVNWFDVVKWCNARSKLEGLTLAYYTDAGLTAVYTTGQQVPYVKWNANGYRLPTEAEWEKAARGGLSGKRFPWGDTITMNQANYYGDAVAYNLSGAFGSHPTYATGYAPYTSPVAAFQPNGYGLYDMAGNIWEWCWDWHDGSWYSNAGATQDNTRGPSSGTYRVLRGGSWSYNASVARCAFRNNYSPSNADISYGGFRCVRGN